jgi:hypothetical protein
LVLGEPLAILFEFRESAFVEDCRETTACDPEHNETRDQMESGQEETDELPAGVETFSQKGNETG